MKNRDRNFILAFILQGLGLVGVVLEYFVYSSPTLEKVAWGLFIVPGLSVLVYIFVKSLQGLWRLG